VVVVVIVTDKRQEEEEENIMKSLSFSSRVSLDSFVKMTRFFLKKKKRKLDKNFLRESSLRYINT